MASSPYADLASSRIVAVGMFLYSPFLRAVLGFQIAFDALFRIDILMIGSSLKGDIH